MIVIAMVDVGVIILAESTISFIGFAIQPPVPSWGNMLTSASIHPRLRGSVGVTGSAERR